MFTIVLLGLDLGFESEIELVVQSQQVNKAIIRSELDHDRITPFITMQVNTRI